LEKMMKKFLASLVLVFGFCGFVSAHGHGSAVTVVHGHHGGYGHYHHPITVGIAYPRPVAAFYNSYYPSVSFNAVSTYPAATSYCAPAATLIEREVVVEKPVVTTVIQKEVVREQPVTTVQREVVREQPVVQEQPVCTYETFSAIAPSYGASYGTSYGSVGTYGVGVGTYGVGFSRGFGGYGGHYGGHNHVSTLPVIRTGGFLGNLGGHTRSVQKVVNRQRIR
jgi:hypothetical protein